MYYSGHENMMEGWDGGGHTHDLVSWIFMFIMMVLVVIGIVFLVRFLTQESSKSSSGNDAIDILKKRYAKGEITKKEFDEIKKDLH